MSILELQFADANGEPQTKVITDDPVGIGLSEDGAAQFAPMSQATATVMGTRTGTWLRVFGERNSVHLNGRPIRHLAWLRAGDRIFLDGHSFFIVAQPSSETAVASDDDAPIPSFALRGLSSDHFGQAVNVGRTLRVGTDQQAELRLPEAGAPREIAKLTALANGVRLEMLAEDVTSQVNGLKVRDGILTAGDQWVLNGRHRYVLESPGESSIVPAEFDDESDLLFDEAELDAKSLERKQLLTRLGWIIAICALISLVVTGLIVYAPH